MSPQPDMISFHGWTRLNETSFLLKVQESSGFQKLIGSYSKSFGVPLDDNNLQGFAEEMCRCCLREADDVMFDDGPLAAALQEVQHYKQKLNECNLAAVKQIAAMRDGCHLSESLKEDTVNFHEPLTFMDEEQQRLVIAVVCDKIRQLQNGTAPPSLVEALTRYAETIVKQEEAAGLDEILEIQSGLQKVRIQKKAVQVRLEYAESESSKLRKELEDLWQFMEVRSTLADTTKAFEELKEQEPTWQESLEELRDLTEHQKAELDQHREHIENLMSAVERREKIIQEHAEETHQLQEELTTERSSREALQAELAEVQKVSAQRHGQLEDLRCVMRGIEIELSSCEEKCHQQQMDQERLQEELKQMEDEHFCERQRLQEDLERLFEQHASLTQEANEMREELDRRNNTETQETQTETGGPVLQELLGDGNRLRVMIEELQMKFRDVLERYRQKFGSKAKELAAETGMDELLREETAFQRLYDDGLLRVQRLEKLREKVRKERSRLGFMDKAEASVLASVEQSDLKGARQILAGTENKESKVSEKGNGHNRAGHSSPPRGPPEALGRMNSSVSLPSLRRTTPSNLNVMSLNLDSSHRGYRRHSKS
ncbi:Hypothetical protein (Fragment) [Durusdinium trenchii]|uniref:Uncharacterized protein n=1 Tax=Durusdinium trenchii TaxID=1381693 RepID=A0ABP0JIL2_9DINO